jgi:hypothetical protein
VLECGGEPWPPAAAAQESDNAKRRGVQQLLGLSDSDAESLLSIVDGGQFKMGGEVEEEEGAFF